MSNFISFKRNLQIDETLNSTKQDNTETTKTAPQQFLNNTLNRTIMPQFKEVEMCFTFFKSRGVFPIQLFPSIPNKKKHIYDMIK